MKSNNPPRAFEHAHACYWFCIAFMFNFIDSISSVISFNEAVKADSSYSTSFYFLFFLYHVVNVVSFVGMIIYLWKCRRDDIRVESV